MDETAAPPAQTQPSSAAKATTPQPLTIEIRTSKLLLLFIVATHLGAVAVFWWLPWPWWLSVLLNGLVVFSIWRCWTHHHWRGTKQLRYSDGDWYWLEDNNKLAVQLIGEYFVSTWMIVMQFRRLDNNRKTYLVLLPDSADSQELRRLRVALRLRLTS